MRVLKSPYIVYIIGLLYCGTFYPAFWTSILVGKMSMILHVLFLLIWAITVGYYCGWKFSKLNSSFNNIYILICLYHLFRFLISADLDNIIQLLRLIIFYIDIYITYNLVSRFKIFMIKYLWFHVIMLALTIIGMVLLALGILQPISIIEISSLGEEKLLNFGLFFVKVHGGASELVDLFARPAGYYDEPGSLGLVVLLLLMYNKVHVNNRIIELLLLIGAYVSMSMAYIVSSVMYICLFFLNKKYLPFLLISVCGVSVLLSNYRVGKNDIADYVYEKTIGRAQRISSSDDQSRNYEASFEAFSNNWLYGASMKTLDENYPDATHETIWYYLAQHGIFGAMILFSPLWLLLLRKNNIYRKSFLLFLIIIYQRPDYFQPLYLTIIYITFYADKTLLSKRKMCE